MSHAASLNGAARAFGFGPPAQANRRGRAPAGLIGRRCIRRRARSAADPGDGRSGGRRERARRGGFADASARRAAACQYRRTGGRRVRNLRRDRDRDGLAGRADGRSGPEGLGCAGRRAFGDSAIHLELCLGLAEQRAAGFRRRAAGGYVRLLSARLSAGRRRAARSRSGAGRNREVAGSWRVGMLLPRRARRNFARRSTAAYCWWRSMS